MPCCQNKEIGDQLGAEMLEMIPGQVIHLNRDAVLTFPSARLISGRNPFGVSKGLS